MNIHVIHEIIRRSHPNYKYTHLFYENVTWNGNIKKKKGRYTIVNIVLPLIWYLNITKRTRCWEESKFIYLFNCHDLTPWRYMKRCHGRLYYDRKFQIFIFLIGHINVNKGVFYWIKHCFLGKYLCITVINCEWAAGVYACLISSKYSA